MRGTAAKLRNKVEQDDVELADDYEREQNPRSAVGALYRKRTEQNARVL